jgi:hypothetical protein
MRRVFEHQEEAKAVAMSGKSDLEHRFTPEQTGRQMRERLHHIWETKNA